MKRIIWTVALVLFSFQAYSQTVIFNFNRNSKDDISPKVREKMDDFQLKISEIVKEEKDKLDLQIQQINRDYEMGKISSQEADQLKLQLSEQSSETINQRIENLNFDLDEVIKNQVTYAILNNDDPNISTQESLKKKYKSTHTLGGYLGYGVMGFTDKENVELDNRLGYLSNFELGVAYEKQFGSASHWSLISGLVMSWRTIRLEDDFQFVRNEDGNTEIVQHDKHLDKSKLRGSYLMLPVGLKYTFGKLATIEDFTYLKPGKFSLHANVYGAVKLSNNNIIKGDDVHQKDKKDYNLNPFVYGVQFGFGYKDVNIYVRKELSNYFDKGSFDDRQMFQFGINLGF